MFRRALLFPALLIGAVGVPYFMFNDGAAAQLKEIWNRVAKRSSASEDETAGNGAAASAVSAGAIQNMNSATAGSVQYAFQPTLEGPPVQDLVEVLRFNATPEWVTSRWSRVSTTLSDIHLNGMRVPLVTGTAVDDLAGTLTYYFDKESRVQRITFDGHTGDDRKLVSVLTSPGYGLKPEPNLGAGLYLAKWGRKPNSMLRIQHAPVINSNSPNTRLKVTLELNNADLEYGLSPKFQALLDRDKNSGRW